MIKAVFGTIFQLLQLPIGFSDPANASIGL